MKKPDNQELFYDSQMAQDELCWRLIANGAEVLRGVLKDTDPSFSVSHSYTGAEDLTGITSDLVNAGNKLSDWTRFGKLIDPKVHEVLNKFGANTLSNTIKAGQDVIDNIGNKIGSSLIGKDNMEELKGFIDTASRGRFFNALDYIKVFQGTSIDFQMPELRTLLLSGCNCDTVVDEVKKLNDTFIGETESFAGMFGLQNSPNKYLPQFEGLDEDTKFPGTFELKVGSKVHFTNLVLMDYEVSFSKFLRIDPAGGPDDYLYADVTVRLAPAAYITKAKLKNYFSLK